MAATVAAVAAGRPLLFRCGSPFGVHRRRRQRRLFSSLPPLNKGVFDKWRRCDRLGWFARRRRVRWAKRSSIQDFAREQGLQFEDSVIECLSSAGQIEATPQMSKNGEDHQNVIIDCERGNIRERVHRTQTALERFTAGLFSDGTGPRALHPSSAISRHAKEQNGVLLLQPTFWTEGVVARPDALRLREEGGPWEVVEIKSCTHHHARKRIPDVRKIL